MGGFAIGVFVCLMAAGGLYCYRLLAEQAKRKRHPHAWRYCPWCKGVLVLGDIDGKEKLHCSRCDFVYWNNPRPKAKALIPTDHGELVLIHGLSGGLELPGGHVEPMETITDGALREILEETGLRVELVREVAVIMPPDRNEHEHFFETKPVSLTEQKLVPGDDASEAFAAPFGNIPYERIAVPWHSDVIKQWLAEREQQAAKGSSQ